MVYIYIYIGVIWVIGIIWGYMLGLYRDTGQERGNYWDI